MSLQRCAWVVIGVRLLGLSIVCALTLKVARADTAAPSDSVNNNKPAEKLRLFTSVHSITYAENISIDAWMDDLHTNDTSPGESAFTRNFSEWGFAYGQMSFAGFVRQDYYLHFSQDTFDIVYQDKNNIPFDANRRYEIFLDVSHVQIHGAKVGYDFSPLKTLQTRIEVNFFDAEEVLFGRLDGYLGTTGGKIKGDLALDYNYTEDVVLDRPLTPPASGRGQSVDVELWWQPIEKLKAHFLAEDLYSQIKWSQTPFTQATITTVRTVTDSSGAVRRAPTISGREYFRQVKQQIPRHFQADIGYQVIEPLRVELIQERFDELAFNRVMAHYRIWSQLELGLGYDEKASAPRLEINSPYVSLMASADSTDGKKAKFVTFSAAVRIAF
jgi:hypothetical protein